MFRVGVLTTSRADWGLIRPLVKCVHDDPETELCLFVTGSHLAPSFGLTISDIDFPISERFDILYDSDSELAVAASAGNAIDMCVRALARQNPGVLVVLGDRSETLACCMAARMLRVPIAHISGGEVTAGSLDDSWRHCITKLASLHFTYCEEYSKRVMQLGEFPDKVFNVGFIALDGLKKRKWLGRRYGQFVVAWHPNTLTDRLEQQKEVHLLLDALEKRDETIYFASANADGGGRWINEAFKKVCENRHNWHFLDMNREQFLERCRASDALIGNSSAGIYEMPAIGVPTINVGDRQKGRLMALSVIECNIKGIRWALRLLFKETFQQWVRNDYPLKYMGKGAARKIHEIIKAKLNEGLSVRKEFYDYGTD